MRRAGQAGGAGPTVRLALFAGLALLTRAPFLTVPFLDLDEAAALVGSWTLLDGGTLYVDFVDNRPPLLYGLYALAQLLLGRGMLAVRLMTTLLVVPFTALAASAFYRHDRRGLVAGLLYVAYGAAFLAHDMHSASPEILMLLPLGWAVALLAHEAEARRPARLLAAGLLVGLAALVRQQALLWLPALALVVLRAEASPRHLGRFLLLVVGVAVPVAGIAALFADAGALPALVYWTGTHSLAYAASPVSPAEALERAASYLLPFLVATAPLWWATWRSAPLFGSTHTRLLVAGLVLCSLPAALLGLRFFPHYFIQLYLPLALGAAPWTARVLERPHSASARVAVAWPAVVLVGFTVANVVLYRGGVQVYEETRPLFQRVASHLRSDPCYGRGPLFVWGFAPQLYAESALRPASRFVVPQASITGYVPGRRGGGPEGPGARSTVRSDHWDQLMEDLESRPPVFVLDTAPAGLHGWSRYPMRDFPRLDAFVRAGYRTIAEVDGVWIWRRKGCEREGS